MAWNFLFRPERAISRLVLSPFKLYSPPITVDAIPFQSAVESLRGEVYAVQ